MKYFVLIFASIFSCLVYAGNCTGEIEKATSEMTFEELIELVEKEGGSSPFGLFIGFDTKSCKLRSVSYDVPL